VACPCNDKSSAFPSLPADTFYASWALGQNVLVTPSYELVIATMGWNPPDDNAGTDAFARILLQAVDRGQAPHA
jgi:hypothetical protein